MKKALLLLILLIPFLSCSPEEETTGGNNQPKNGFNFEGEFYPTDFAYFRDDNTVDDEPQEIAIVLGNIDFLKDSQDSGVNFIYLEVFQATLETGTLSSLNEYGIYYNTAFRDSKIDEETGEMVLNDDLNGGKARSIAVNIIEFTASRLHMEFSFTREDGKTVTGTYNGTYTDMSNY
ncbi:hypothetical protein [Salegentibacter chungangensis]|uniref:Lipoprotein n=1 Tax=Salegentibacter chungangensis TaxID=1335724 RepID=A0ABW3NPA6_9FLAO